MFTLKEALQVLNERRALIAEYAIAGGIGAMFFIETSLSNDIDIFVTLPTHPDEMILSRYMVIGRGR